VNNDRSVTREFVWLSAVAAAAGGFALALETLHRRFYLTGARSNTYAASRKRAPMSCHQPRDLQKDSGGQEPGQARLMIAGSPDGRRIRRIPPQPEESLLAISLQK
jgi:hypothetical protein